MTKPAPTIVETECAAPASCFRPTLLRLWRDEQGQDLVEYCLILSALGLGAFALCGNIGSVVSTGFNNIGNSLTARV